jgi:outer membrane protein assembly factor BamB
MRKYRVGLVPSRGVEILPVAQPLYPGEPTQQPQLNNRRDSACLVVRSLNSAGCTALLVNLQDGEIRWQRQLGVVPAAVPVLQEGSVVLASEDGGIVSLPGVAVRTGQTTVAPPDWVVGAAPENVASPTNVAASPDGKILFTVTPVLMTEDSKQVAKWLIRRVVAGRVVHEGSVPAPGELAGLPVVLGDSLVLPASDGFLYRHLPGTGRANPDKLAAGPPWVSGGRPAEAVCSIIPVGDSTFFTGDGGKTLSGWSWPKGDRWGATAAKIELRERPAGIPTALPPTAPAEPARLLVADVSGSVWLYAADRAGPPLRRWKPGSGIPAGKPSSAFTLQTPAGQRPVATYTVDNKHVVCIDPEQEAPKWSTAVTDTTEGTLVGPPQSLGDGRWTTTDLGGRLTVLDTAGAKTGTVFLGLPGAVPAVAAAPIGGDAALFALSDGSTVVVRLPAPVTAAPEAKPKE